MQENVTTDVVVPVRVEAVPLMGATRLGEHAFAGHVGVAELHVPPAVHVVVAAPLTV